MSRKCEFCHVTSGGYTCPRYLKVSKLVTVKVITFFCSPVSPTLDLCDSLVWLYYSVLFKEISLKDPGFVSEGLKNKTGKKVGRIQTKSGVIVIGCI
jgi:hypothetical protein